MQKKAVPILIIVLLVLVAGAGYLAYRVTSMKQDPNAAALKEAQSLVATVGKLILLPKDEVPTVATVSDPSKLADQPFFAKAKAGDKVLLYTNAKKAYLFDPVNNKILEVAPLNLGAAGPAASKAPAAPKTTPATTPTTASSTKTAP